MGPSPLWVHKRRYYLAGKSRDVLLQNLHYKLGRNAIAKLCSPYGKLEDVFIPEDENGYRRGRAFVRFEEKHAANRCVWKLHGRRVLNLEMKVGFKPSFRDERQLKKMTVRDMMWKSKKVTWKRL